MSHKTILDMFKRLSGIRKIGWVWLLLAVYAGAAFILMALLGTVGGVQAARIERESTQVAERVQGLLEQYHLGVQDFQAGDYDLARQRFEFVLSKDPGFPGAADQLAQVMQILSATATATPVPATVTPTPTRDMRPVEDLFNSVKNLFLQGDWNGTVEMILALRQADPMFRVTEVDGFLYRALRNRGVLKITVEGNLEGGIYDLSLAEQFGPLDADALKYRDLARYYMMGSGFWEVYPEQAVYYFGLVVSALPSLRDGSGWTAAARYQAALVQWGDQLAKDGDWCSAQQKYEIALSYGGDGNLRDTVEQAAIRCSPPTETPLPELATETPSLTPTLWMTPTLTLTPFFTPPVTPTPTPTATDVATPTSTPEPTIVVTTELPPTQQPSQTPTPTDTVEPSPTPTVEPPPLPTATDTDTFTPTEALAPTITISPAKVDSNLIY